MIKSIVALNGVTWNDFNKCLNTGSPDILHVHATDDDWVDYDGAPQVSMAGNPIGPSPTPEQILLFPTGQIGMDAIRIVFSKVAWISLHTCPESRRTCLIIPTAERERESLIGG